MFLIGTSPGLYWQCTLLVVIVELYVLCYLVRPMNEYTDNVNHVVTTEEVTLIGNACQVRVFLRL